jgi:hypothetical protein
VGALSKNTDRLETRNKIISHVQHRQVLIFRQVLEIRVFQSILWLKRILIDRDINTSDIEIG